MSEESYWLIEIADHTHMPKRRVGDGHYLEYYPDGGSVAEIVFTNRERAERYAAQACDAEHIEWRVAPIGGRSELNHAMSISGPKKTHVLLDPEYGNEEDSLRPVDWH